MGLKRSLFKVRACPKNEVLISFFLKEQSLPEAERLLDHILICERCRLKFDVLKELNTKMANLKSTIASEPLTPTEEMLLRKTAQKKMKELRKSLRQPKGRFLGLIPYPYAAAAFLLLLAAGYFLFTQYKPTEVLRKEPGIEFQLVMPQGLIASPPSVFFWVPPKEAEHFSFQLIDDELNELYTADTRDPKVLLPEKIRLSLKPGKTYLWKVEAFDDLDRSLSCRQASFEIKGK